MNRKTLYLSAQQQTLTGTSNRAVKRNMQHLQPWGSLPASHTHAHPRWRTCSAHTSSSAEQPSPQMHHLHAAWSPSSDQVHREAWSGAPRSPAKGTLGGTSRRETPLPAATRQCRGPAWDRVRQQANRNQRTDRTNCLVRWRKGQNPQTWGCSWPTVARRSQAGVLETQQGEPQSRTPVLGKTGHASKNCWYSEGELKA